MSETQRLEARVEEIANGFRTLERRVDDQNRIHHEMHAQNRETLQAIQDAVQSQTATVQSFVATTDGRLNQLETGYRSIRRDQGAVAAVATEAATAGATAGATAAIRDTVPALTRRAHAKWSGYGIAAGSAIVYVLEKILSHWHLLP